MESLSAPLALVVLVLDVLAIAHVWRSPIEAGRKIIWTLVIVLLPVVGLATTELASVIDSGHNGFVDTRLPRLVGVMRELLRDRALAGLWGQAGQRLARERFGIERFVADWLEVFVDVAR